LFTTSQTFVIGIELEGTATLKRNGEVRGGNIEPGIINHRNVELFSPVWKCPKREGATRDE
jgi:hypothetical protein